MFLGRMKYALPSTDLLVEQKLFVTTCITFLGILLDSWTKVLATESRGWYPSVFEASDSLNEQLSLQHYS